MTRNEFESVPSFCKTIVACCETFYLQPLATFFFGETTKFLDVTCGVDGAIQHQNLHEKAKKIVDSKNTRTKRKTSLGIVVSKFDAFTTTYKWRHNITSWIRISEVVWSSYNAKKVSAVTLVILMVWASTPWLDFSKVNVNFAHCMTLIMKTMGPNYNSNSTSTQSSYTFFGWHNYWQNIDIMIVRMM